MSHIRINYNQLHNQSGYVWKINVDGHDRLATGFEIKGKSYGESGKSYWVACDGEVTWVKNHAYIVTQGD